MWFLATLALILLPLLLLVALVDPLQRVGSPVVAMRFGADPRLHLPGLARHHPYDSVVMGSSISVNLRPPVLRFDGAGRILNLAIPGGGLGEQRRLLELALKSRAVRTVLWEASPGLLIDDGRIAGKSAVPFYLYEDGPVAVLRYLTAMENVQRSLSVVAELAGFRPRGRIDQDAALGHPYTPDARALVRQARAVQAELRQHPPAPERSDMTAAVRQIEQLVETHPDTRFVFILPPVSAVQHAIKRDYQPAQYHGYLRAMDRLAELAGRANVDIYDFASWPVVFEPCGFSDMVHHGLETDRAMVLAMAEGRDRLDGSGRPGERLERLMRGFDLSAALDAAADLSCPAR